MNEHNTTLKNSLSNGTSKDSDYFTHRVGVNEQNNVFPTDALPPIFRNLINESQKSLNFSPDYTGTAILTAVSTAIGTSAKLKVKNNWFELASLYTAIIGNSGVCKSHPLSFVFDVLVSIDEKKLEKFKPLHNEFEEYQKLNKKEKSNTLKVNKPILIKSIMNNFTPEVLHHRLSDNPRGCAIVSDELETFLEGMNNYSRGDQASVYLSYWSNKPTSIDRVSKPIPLFIKQPFLNIIGSLQPKILNKLFPVNKTNNGFLQRFLFAYPSNLEKYPINDIELNEDVINQYNDFITTYINNNPIEIDSTNHILISKMYYWSEDARKYFFKWQKENTIKVNQNAESLKGEIISKFDNHFVRLALILQIMNDYTTNNISLKAVESASLLCDYYMNCAFKVLDIIDKSTPTDVLTENKQKFYDALPNNFITGEAIRIGETSFGMNDKFVKRFIANTELFINTSHGKYSKINN